MQFNFMWEALTVLFTGFCLLRILGKKTVGEMTGLEIITLLAMASMIGHAVTGDGLWKTLITLCIFVSLLVTIQFLAVRFDWIEKWFMGKATIIIEEGQIIPANLKKLRLTVDQLEAKLREKGIVSFADLKTATIEMSGELGYEWAPQAKPVTARELDQMNAQLKKLQQQLQQSKQQQQQQQKQQQDKQTKQKQQQKPPPNLFTEVINQGHDMPIQQELD